MVQINFLLLLTLKYVRHHYDVHNNILSSNSGFKGAVIGATFF